MKEKHETNILCKDILEIIKDTAKKKKRKYKTILLTALKEDKLTKYYSWFLNDK